MLNSLIKVEEKSLPMVKKEEIGRVHSTLSI
jgi:hypothetical protein